MSYRTYLLKGVTILAISLGISTSVFADDSSSVKTSNVEQSSEEIATSERQETTATSSTEMTINTEESSTQVEETKKLQTKRYESEERYEVVTKKVDFYVTNTTKNLRVWTDLLTADSRENTELYEQTFHVKTELQLKEKAIETKVQDELTTEGSTQLLETETTEKQLDNQTVADSIKPSIDTVYYGLYDNKDQFYGYVAKEDVKKAAGPQGIWLQDDSYVVINKKDFSLFNDFKQSIRQSTNNLLNNVYHVSGKYHHVDGIVYYSLYNHANQWQGYIDRNLVEKVAGPEGNPIETNQYVRITNKNYTIWEDFSWKKGRSAADYYDKVLLVKNYYNHYNGAVYYALTTNDNQLIGYINRQATEKVAGAQGPWKRTSKYVTLMTDNQPIYNNFNWDIRGNTNQKLKKTYKVTGYYNHLNGKTYYSLYDYQNRWHGYIDSAVTTEASGAHGVWIADSNHFVTMTQSGYSVYRNFDWHKMANASQLINSTLQVKGYYQHMNGSTYYSLYDNKGIWHGYINKNGISEAPGTQGVWLSTNLTVKISSKNYDVYNNFNWSRRNQTKNLYGQTFRVTGYYHHYNGANYYSLYDKEGRWHGYVNAGATSLGRTAGAYLETSRERVVSLLNSHRNDRFYLTTPYRGLSNSFGKPEPAKYLSPKGAPTYYGPGMNCTGFIADVIQRSGGNINRITQVSNAWGGVANGYNWRDTLRAKTEYHIFNNASEMIASGKARKGDILYFEPNYNIALPDCHLGIFWGNNPKDNLIWHSVGEGNRIDRLYNSNNFSKVYVFTMD
ncbi:hypothetical protein CBF34_06505 [Vagococcus penaei]|uniref:Uncharacterized protein n=1 Tax=Vagococcus penaei TaxID=633807 RepID=A0A1Q2D6R8_9ENTE|nr:hypothetical protein [Vagococcus penaei]AQP54064.1 hypothetical protein BW732_07440 [Vagococcus penaei]RSU01703.1 hypothetical protein CBF34_06505 [Vagococcus penaei]